VDLASAVNVFDNLLDSNKTEPLIGVFVKPNNRNTEYGGSLREEYQLFFIEELVPFIDSNYNTIKDAASRLVMGASLGGNISSLISYNNSEVFANCGIHSGALWVNNNEALNLIINGSLEDIKWNSIWGSYESIAPDMRMLKNALIAKGYEIDWIELPEGHSWGLWRATIDKMLIYFFPSTATEVEDGGTHLPESFYLHQNFPNPFNPTTNIKFRTTDLGFVSLKVYDILSKEITTLVNDVKPAGSYEVIFSASELTSGIYFYTLQAGQYIETRKMTLLR